MNIKQKFVERGHESNFVKDNGNNIKWPNSSAILIRIAFASPSSGIRLARNTKHFRKKSPKTYMDFDRGQCMSK